MNSFTQYIIKQFRSRDNVLRMKKMIELQCGKNQYLENNIDNLVETFVQYMTTELYKSDPMPGTTVNDHVNYYSNKFIKVKTEFLQSMRMTPTYTNDPSAHIQYPSDTSTCTDDILGNWRRLSARPQTARMDPSANNTDEPIDLYISSRQKVPTNTGYNLHHDLFETNYMRCLNKTDRPHELTPFGVDTPAANDRLLSRRSRKGIPRYEVSLYSRRVERDISEGLRGDSNDMIQRGYDMKPLRRRLHIIHN